MKKVLIISSLLFIFLSATLYAQTELKFAGVQDVPPFVFEEGNQVKGIDYEVFLELEKRVGFKGTVKALPFKRLWLMLQDGDLDGTIQIYYNKDREADIIFSDTPMHWSAHYIFVRKADLSSYSTYGLEALYGKTVGKNSGFFVTKEFEEAVKAGKLKLREAKTTDSNLQKLNLGRIDCFVSNYHIALLEIKKLGLQGKVVPLPEPFAAKKGTFFALSKKGTGIADKSAFLKKINKALKEIHEDGTLDRLTAKYTN